MSSFFTNKRQLGDTWDLPLGDPTGFCSVTEMQSKRYCLLAQIYQMCEKVKPCVADTMPAFGHDGIYLNLADLNDLALRDQMASGKGGGH